MVQALTKVGTSMYEAAGAAAGAEGGAGPDFATNGAGGAAGGPEEEATVEGEFREVGSDR
jgi:hypothetical protein